MHANLLHLMASWGIWPKSDGKQFHIYPENNGKKYVKLERIWSQNEAGEKKCINIFKYFNTLMVFCQCINLILMQ